LNELIDIGANLGHSSFDEDRRAVLERAAAAGITRLIVTGTSVTESAKALEIAEIEPTCYATAGIHPHHASEFDASSVPALRQLAGSPRVVAIGECGLDYYRNFSPRAAQLTAFAAQLDLAIQCRMPVFLHQRDAHDDFIGMLRERSGALSGGVAHCFTGNREQLAECLELGLHVGVTGWVCDTRRGAALREAVPSIPLDRLLLETDAPYLLPHNIDPKPRSRRNEPSFLIYVLETVSTLLGLSIYEVAAATTRNAERLFALGN